MIEEGRYLAAKTVSDVWICYPWEAMFVNTINPIFNRPSGHADCLRRDIDEHDRRAVSQPSG